MCCLLWHYGGGDTQPGIGVSWEVFSQGGCMNWAIEFAPSILVMDTVDQIGPLASIVPQPWLNVFMDLPKQWEFFLLYC